VLRGLLVCPSPTLQHENNDAKQVGVVIGVIGKEEWRRRVGGR
jgi:hypothetical protein